MARKTKAIAKTDHYEPTPREIATLRAYIARKEEATTAPRMKLTKKNGKMSVTADHPEPAIGELLLMEAIGTKALSLLFRDHNMLMTFGGAHDKNIS